MRRPSRDPLSAPATPTWSPASRQLHDHLLAALSHTPPGSRTDAVRRCASDLSTDLDAGAIASARAEAILTQLIQISQAATSAPAEQSRPTPP